MNIYIITYSTEVGNGTAFVAADNPTDALYVVKNKGAYNGTPSVYDKAVVKLFGISNDAKCNTVIHEVNKGVDKYKGKDGKDGINGRDGKDGKDATINGKTAITLEGEGNIKIITGSNGKVRISQTDFVSSQNVVDIWSAINKLPKNSDIADIINNINDLSTELKKYVDDEIKNTREYVDVTVEDSKVKVIDNTSTDDSNSALSARSGLELSGRIDKIEDGYEIEVKPTLQEYRKDKGKVKQIFSEGNNYYPLLIANNSSMVNSHLTTLGASYYSDQILFNPYLGTLKVGGQLMAYKPYVDSKLEEKLDKPTQYLSDSLISSNIARTSKVSEVDGKVSGLSSKVDEVVTITDKTTETTSNLIKLQDITTIVNGVSVTTSADGTIIIKGTGSADGGRTKKLCVPFELAAGDYAVSYTPSVDITAYLHDVNNTILASGTTKFSLSSPTQVYIGVNIVKGQGYDVKLHAMLVEGISAQPYLPPFSSRDVIARQQAIDVSKEVHQLINGIVRDTYINYTTGLEGSTGSYVCTRPIFIYGLSKIAITTATANDLSGIAFYDVFNTFISGVKTYGFSDKTEVDVPNGAAFVRVTCLTSNMDFLSVEIQNLAEDKNRAQYGLAAYSTINGGPVNVSDEIQYESGKYITKAGVVSSLAVYSTSLPFPLLKGEKINISAYIASAGAVAGLSKWTDKGVYVSTIYISKETSTNKLEYIEYTATDDVEFLRISYYSNSRPRPVVVKSQYGLKEIKRDITTLLPSMQSIPKLNSKFWSVAMWKVLCIGDSLTSGASYREEWGEVAPTGASIDQNYPRMLGRMLNGEVTNAGFSGYSASTWYNNKIGEYNFANYDTFIIWLGTNNGLTDTLDADVNSHSDYHDFATTETGYYCKIIEAIKEQNNDCLIVLTKVFASKGNVATTNVVIDKIAEKYNLPVIDNSDLSHTARPELHCNTNNPHFGKAGNAYIANRYIERLGEWFEDDPTRSEFGYTARTN